MLIIILNESIVFVAMGDRELKKVKNFFFIFTIHINCVRWFITPTIFFSSSFSRLFNHPFFLGNVFYIYIYVDVCAFVCMRKAGCKWRINCLVSSSTRMMFCNLLGRFGNFKEKVWIVSTWSPFKISKTFDFLKALTNHFKLLWIQLPLKLIWQ